MDANGNLIPIVEDDQGEGIMDPVENTEVRRRKKLMKKLEAQFEEATAQGKKLDAARILKKAKRLVK